MLPDPTRDAVPVVKNIGGVPDVILDATALFKAQLRAFAPELVDITEGSGP